MPSWTYQAAKEIDLTAWDAQALRQSGSSIYLHSSYLDEVAPGWGLLKNEQNIQFPVWLQQRFGLKMIRQPLFIQHFRPVMAGFDESFELNSLLQQLQSMATVVELQLDMPPQAVPVGWKQHDRTTYRLPLLGGIEQLRGQYSTHHKRHLKKPDDMKLGIYKNEAAFVRLLKTEMPGKTGLSAKVFDQVANLITWISIKRRGQLFAATDGDELLAACYILHSGDRLLYQWAVSSEAGKARHAMFRLIDQVLATYSGSGMEFDFEGSMIPGLQRFYAGFGAKPYLYVRLTHSKLPAFLNRILHVG
jgi:hypothetical protein